ncbi:MAG TPA: hypothetical protein VFY93_06125 [Planctomycetota bacterium]|nr:hypothetical protein [Planctomycetota bacterium]
MRFSATIQLARAGAAAGRRVALSCEAIPGSAARLFRHEDPETGCLCAVAGYVVDPGWYREDDPARGAREVFETYRSRGPEAAFDRNGVYAVVIDDPRDGSVHCAVDKYGIFPLFWSAGPSELLLDADFGALAANVGRTLDDDAIEEYLAVGNPLADRTFFREIKRLGPGRYLRIDAQGRIGSPGRYWWFDRLPYVGSRDLEACVKDNNEAFAASIGDFKRIVGEPICLVSSGYDSRRILLELLRQGAAPRTYTVELLHKRFEAPVSIEDRVVRSLLSGRESHHTSLPLPGSAEMPDLIERRERLLGQQADEHEWVLPLVDRIPRASGTNFDGLGGDTLCNADLAICGPEATARYSDPDYLARHLWPNRFATYLSAPFRARFKGTLFERISAEIADLPDNPNRLFLLELVGRSRRTTSLFALTLLAEKVDSVFPYLDDRMVVSALKADPFWKRDVNLQKVLLDRAYPGFRDLPSSHSMPDAVDDSYRQAVTHLFNGSAPPPHPARTLRHSAQLRHAFRSRPPGRPSFLSAKGRLAVVGARVALALGLDVGFANAAYERLWSVPKLLKLERLLGARR